MACELSTGFFLDCKNGVGGVQRVFVSTWDSNIELTINENGLVTLVAGPATYYEYDLPPQTADFKDVVSYNKEAGTYVYTQSVNVMIHKLSAAKREEFKNLVAARLCLWVLDANNNLWFIGASNPVDVTAFEASSGKALSDANGYSITFTCESPLPAYLCTGQQPNLD
jgi:hypothetical protein